MFKKVYEYNITFIERWIPLNLEREICLKIIL